MKPQILFTEKQRVTQVWVWLLMFLPFVIVSTIAVIQVGFGQTVGNKPLPNDAFWFMLPATLMPLLMLRLMHLTTEITESEIRVQLFPFHLRMRSYPRTAVAEAYVRTYKPLAEYGGWGIKGSNWRKQGLAFNMSGNQGIQLVFRDGKRLLIGTLQAEAASRALQAWAPTA